MASLKLLIVEDDIASLELMTEVFSSLEARVCSASDGKRAANLVENEKFDGIFLDLQLPDVPGFELAKKVRQSSWNKSTPIIIVTGHDQRDAMRQSFATGATFYLQKPVDRQKLTNLFRTVRGTLFENHCRHVRIAFRTEVSCRVGSRKLSGKSWNLSQGGLQVEVDGLKVDDKVEVSFRLPDSQVPIDAAGEVVWAEAELQGIRFTSVGAHSQSEIRRTIAQAETAETVKQ